VRQDPTSHLGLTGSNGYETKGGPFACRMRAGRSAIVSAGATGGSGGIHVTSKSLLAIILLCFPLSGCADLVPRSGPWRLYAPHITRDSHGMPVADTSRPLSQWTSISVSYASEAQCDADQQGLFEEARKEVRADFQAQPNTARNTPERENQTKLILTAVSMQGARCIEDREACDQGLQGACIRYQAALEDANMRRQAGREAVIAAQQQSMQEFHDRQMMMQQQMMMPHGFIVNTPSNPYLPSTINPY
jgi:hypothetical protein